MKRMGEFTGVTLELDSKDKTEGYFGMRSFALDTEGRLVSPVQAMKWRPGINEAVNRRSGPASVFDSDDGFYSYHTKEKARTYDRQSSVPVVGTVRCTGRIEIGNNGMRAQKAEIVGLVQPGWVHDPDKKKRNWSMQQRLGWSLPWPLWWVGAAALSYYNASASNIFSIIWFIFFLLLVIFTGFTLVVTVLDDERKYNKCSYGRALCRYFYGSYFIMQDRNKNGAVDMDVIMRNAYFNRMRDLYPEVTIYPSLDAMYKAYKFEDPTKHEEALAVQPPAFKDPSEPSFWG